MFTNMLINWLPLRCELCRSSMIKSKNSDMSIWCKACHSSVVRQARCLRCGILTQQNVALQDSVSCGACLKTPPSWDNLYCIDNYRFPYNKLIHRFKYQGQFWLAKNFAAMLAKEIQTPAPLLLPVPMHWQRKLSRGYNHSHVLAIQLAKALDVNCAGQIIQRIRATKQQQGLSRKARLVNLRGAFELKKTPLPKHIALVDDVVTTGATLNEICKLLKKNSIERIDIYCIARSERETR